MSRHAPMGIDCPCEHGDEDREHAAEVVWNRLEAEPGFSEELRQAKRDIEEGRGIPFREVQRKR